jgi:ATP-binding cassette subfamily B protein
VSFFTVYRRVLGLLAAEKYLAIFIAVANLFVAAFQFVEPVLFGRLINLLASSDHVPRARLIAQAVHLLGIWALVGLAGIGANMSVALQADRLAHRNRLAAMARFFRHVLSLPPSFHRDRQSGRLLKIMLSGADNLFGLWLSFFREHLATFIATIILLPLTLMLNWRMALALIALVVLFCVLTSLIIRRTQAAQREVEKYHSELAGTAQDTLSNVIVVQAFTRLGTEISHFGSISRQVLDRQFPVLNWWALLSVLTQAASTLTVISIFLLGTWLHLQGEASVGSIVSFMGFATLLIGRLQGAMGFVSRLFFQLPTLADFFGVLDQENALPEPAGAASLAVTSGEVRFENVSFHYREHAAETPPTLRDVSFTATPGSVVALVGATGAGKSTAMALLQRHWDCSAGRITIDGQDIRSVSLDSLRAAIGVVFQDSLLFNRSIRENLLVGRPDASQEELEKACQMAEALPFIRAQAQGFDTLIGERGATLSGGQRQRLAIARAILKDPPLLVLDEATSALDAATEAKVARALRALMKGRTAFVIAHRLSTIRDADLILVLDEGRIIEQGDFAGLIARDGAFAKLIQAQLPSGPPQS